MTGSYVAMAQPSFARVEGSYEAVLLGLIPDALAAGT